MTIVAWANKHLQHGPAWLIHRLAFTISWSIFLLVAIFPRLQDLIIKHFKFPFWNISKAGSCIEQDRLSRRMYHAFICLGFVYLDDPVLLRYNFKPSDSTFSLIRMLLRICHYLFIPATKLQSTSSGSFFLFFIFAQQYGENAIIDHTALFKLTDQQMIVFRVSKALQRAKTYQTVWPYVW